MRSFEIRNIGPISEAVFHLARLNVFIGEQSSGKSTIAKIISFCLWLEKNVIQHQSVSHINDDFIDKQLLDYHRMTSYFNEQSFIEFKGPLLSIRIKGTRVDSVRLVGNLLQGDVAKVAYVPSERNFVTIPNIASLTLDGDYMRDFLFEWLRICPHFSSKSPLSILNLGVRYQYDSAKGSRLLLDNGKEIALKEASSGLQSLVPLMVSLVYHAEWIYSHTLEISYEKYQWLRQQLIQHIAEVNEADGEGRPMRNVDDLINDALNGEKPGRKYASDYLREIYEFALRIARPRSTHLVIEEPEQNLYPTTQRDLMLLLISQLSAQAHCESVTITTHSPYVLSTLNVLMAASRLADTGKQLPADIDGISPDMLLDTSDYAAFYVDSNGVVCNIVDSDLQMISGNNLDGVSDWVDDNISRIYQVLYG